MNYFSYICTQFAQAAQNTINLKKNRMKQQLIVGLMAFISLFLFTGCIDFLEDITYHRNGSGSYKFTMDASAIGELVNSMGKDEKPEGLGGMNDMGKAFMEMEDKLKNVPGISNFKAINDTINYLFGFSYDFKNATALNIAMQQQDPKETVKKTMFSGKKRKLIRSNNGGMADVFKKEMAGEGDENMEMAKGFLADMKLRTVYHFDRKVKSSSNENSLISKDKKEVTIDYYFFKPEMNKGNEGIGTTIKLKCW